MKRRTDMKIKFTALILLAVVACTCSGCGGTWRRKFVRAKKSDVKEGPVLQPHDYAREFSNRQLYANNYAFWRNAESELIKSIKLKDNLKRISSQSGYSLVYLKKLYSLLLEEKNIELEPYITELEDIIEKIEQPNYVSSNSNVLVARLSRHYRSLSRDFSYRKMQNFIKPDEEETEKNDK
jgi:hypothetical protein